MGRTRKSKSEEIVAEITARHGCSSFSMDQLRQILFDLDIGVDKRTASSHLEVLVEMMHSVAFDNEDTRNAAKLTGYNFDVISRSKYHINDVDEMKSKEEENDR